MFIKSVIQVLVISLLFVFSAGVVKAQELDLSVTPVVSPTPAPVEYQLPYPGVLPGHFLYTLKDLRDNFMSFLISNPIKKAEFDLLQSDKRIQAAYMLVERDPGKVDVAKETIAKAQEYFAEALEKTNAAKKEGMDINDLTKRLTVAQEKHMEVLLATADKLGKDGKKQLADAEKREIEFSKQVKKLKP